MDLKSTGDIKNYGRKNLSLACGLVRWQKGVVWPVPV